MPEAIGQKALNTQLKQAFSGRLLEQAERSRRYW